MRPMTYPRPERSWRSLRRASLLRGLSRRSLRPLCRGRPSLPTTSPSNSRGARGVRAIPRPADTPRPGAAVMSKRKVVRGRGRQYTENDKISGIERVFFAARDFSFFPFSSVVRRRVIARYDASRRRAQQRDECDQMQS
eukprot:29350-Pelagococcus_subviridis.AAC.4